MAKESDLFYPIKKYYESKNIMTWQEVKLGNHRLAPICDMVALVSDDTYFAIELKNTLNFDVLAQAFQHYHKFSGVCVAVPAPKNITYKISRGRKFAHDVCKVFGIGLIYCYEHDKKYYINPDNFFYIKPRVKESDTVFIEQFLRERSKDMVAGEKSVSPETPWKESMRNIQAYLEQHFEATTSTLFKNVKTHYTSVDAMRRSLKFGVKNIYCVKRKNKLYWRIKNV